MGKVKKKKKSAHAIDLIIFSTNRVQNNDKFEGFQPLQDPYLRVVNIRLWSLWSIWCRTSLVHSARNSTKEKKTKYVIEKTCNHF